MAKKKRRDKEVARLRREIELLKAQMASGTPAKEKASTRQAKDKRPAAVAREVTPTLNSTYLKKDLRKSLLLTLAALGILTVLYFR